ncbi:MAG: response regulator [Gammaproteobacteria bacterium]|nr:response regulator [Gammaproteobacteria bacterium]
MRVLLIDDHTLFREGLAGLLKRRNIDAAAAGDGRAGVRRAEAFNPDVILLDLRMPDIDGLEVLDHLMRQRVAAPVVMLSTSSDQADLAEALRKGAKGYLLKDMEPDALVAALYEIAAGKTVVAPGLTPVLAELVKRGDPPAPQPAPAPFSALTRRELEILCHLSEGRSNKAIARNLDISDGTVKLHVKAILRKLKVHSRVEAAVMAVENGLRRRIKTGGQGGQG